MTERKQGAGSLPVTTHIKYTVVGLLVFVATSAVVYYTVSYSYWFWFNFWVYWGHSEYNADEYSIFCIVVFWPVTFALVLICYAIGVGIYEKRNIFAIGKKEKTEKRC